MTLRLDRTAGRLWRGDGRCFEPRARAWEEAAGGPRGEPVSVLDAVTWLQRDSGELLAGLGLTVICGGRQGVMEAVCRGVERAGGLSVGLLPEGDPAAANRHVSVPIATGIGVARNAIIARASLALVAVGGGIGTTAEVAFGLQFGVPVFGLLDAPALDGVRACPDPETAVEEVAKTVLNINDR